MCYSYITLFYINPTPIYTLSVGPMYMGPTYMRPTYMGPTPYVS
jgi:hypothetical protein